MSIASKPAPKGWPRISSSLAYDKAAPAIDWLCRAFGFEVQLRVDGENGRVEHSELVLGGGLISLGDAREDKRPWRKSPKSLGGANTQTLCVYVDDVDAHCERARAAGATIVSDLADHGPNRIYVAGDCGGQLWIFATPVLAR